MQNEKISNIRRIFGSIWAINIYALSFGWLVSASFLGFKIPSGEEHKLLLLFTTITTTTLANLWYLRFEVKSLETKINQKTKDITSSINFIDRLDNTDLKLEIHSLANLIIQINLNTTNDFLKSQVIHSLNLFQSTLSNIHSGFYKCSYDDELLLTQELISKPKKSIKAVSYQDIDWWLSSYGTAYLSVQNGNNSMNPSFISQRIFIVNNDEKEKLQEVFNKHKELKIEYFIIHPTEVPPPCLLDFVIYDDEILRIADSESMGIGKRAKITVDKSELLDAKNKFKMLLDMVSTE